VEEWELFVIIGIKERHKIQGIIGSNENSLTNLGERKKKREISQTKESTQIKLAITPWRKDLLEKLLVAQLVQRFISSCESRSYFAPLTDIRSLSLKGKVPVLN
jgi:hypothetical protein